MVSVVLHAQETDPNSSQLQLDDEYAIQSIQSYWACRGDYPEDGLISFSEGDWIPDFDDPEISELDQIDFTEWLKANDPDNAEWLTEHIAFWLDDGMIGDNLGDPEIFIDELKKIIKDYWDYTGNAPHDGWITYEEGWAAPSHGDADWVLLDVDKLENWLRQHPLYSQETEQIMAIVREKKAAPVRLKIEDLVGLNELKKLDDLIAKHKKSLEELETRYRTQRAFEEYYQRHGLPFTPRNGDITQAFYTNKKWALTNSISFYRNKKSKMDYQKMLGENGVYELSKGDRKEVYYYLKNKSVIKGKTIVFLVAKEKGVPRERVINDYFPLSMKYGNSLLDAINYANDKLLDEKKINVSQLFVFHDDKYVIDPPLTGEWLMEGLPEASEIDVAWQTSKMLDKQTASITQSVSWNSFPIVYTDRPLRYGEMRIAIGSAPIKANGMPLDHIWALVKRQPTIFYPGRGGNLLAHEMGHTIGYLPKNEDRFGGGLDIYHHKENSNLMYPSSKAGQTPDLIWAKLFLGEVENELWANDFNRK